MPQPEILLAGLATGSVYALIAIGFNVIFKSTDALNFAQGEWVMLGGMLSAFLFHAYQLPVWSICILSAMAVALLGIASERVSVRVMLYRNALSITLITVGLALFTRGLVMLTLGKEPQGYPGVSGDLSVVMFGANVPAQTFWIIGLTILLMAATHLFFERTRFGVAMRAAAADPEAAALVGINNNLVISVCFGIAALFGGMAGAIITPLTLMSYEAGLILGFKGFCAAMLGGLGNLYGAAIGGILLGLTESLVTAYVTTQFKDGFSFFLLLVLLFARPQGLFGQPHILKV